jgi:hypothetical protein
VPEPNRTPLSAQVILRPSDPSVAAEPVTSANLSRHAPPAGAVDEVTAYFGERGFDVGPFVGTSFSITGPASAFRDLFGDDLPAGTRGSLEFDVRALPARVRRRLQAISFSEPLDFGPGAP